MYYGRIGDRGLRHHSKQAMMQYRTIAGPEPKIQAVKQHNYNVLCRADENFVPNVMNDVYSFMKYYKQRMP